MYLLLISVSSLEKCLFRSSIHFWLDCLFFTLNCMSCLYILDINPLSVPWLANIFCCSVDYLLILFMVSFAVQKHLSLIRCHLFISVVVVLLFSCSALSDSLQSHGLQHTRLPCPSLSPRVPPSSCPLSRWYCPTTSSSTIPLSFCLQSSQHQGFFPMSWLFISGGQSIGTSASASVLPINIQGWFPLGLTGLISLMSKGLSRVFSNTTIQKHQFFGTLLYDPILTSIMTTGKTIDLTKQTLLAKWCFCFLICCLGFSQLSWEVASVF